MLGRLRLSTVDSVVIVGHWRAKGMARHAPPAGDRGYEGVDRRNRTAAVTADLPIGRVVRATALIGAGATIPVAVQLAQGVTLSEISTFEAVLGGLFGVTAGLALLVCWRILGTAARGWSAVALLDLGLLTIALSGPPVVAFVSFSGLEPLDHLVVALSRGLADPKGGPCPSSRRGIFARSCTGPFHRWVVVRLWRAELLRGASPAAGRLHLVDLREHRRGHDDRGVGRCRPRRHPHPGRPPSLLPEDGRLRRPLGCGVADQRRVSRDGRWLVVAASLTLLAVALALGSAAVQVQELLVRQDRHQLRMHLDLSGVRRQRTSEQRDVEEHLHELRNAVAAVCTAEGTLRRYAGSLDEPAQARCPGRSPPSSGACSC